MRKTPRIFPFRIDEKTYTLVKKLAFLEQKHMAEVIREGIELKVKASKKVLNTEVVL